jgi:hypothetical protein
MHQQLWGYKVEEKLYVGVREQKRLNTAGLDDLVSPALFLERRNEPLFQTAVSLTARCLQTAMSLTARCLQTAMSLTARCLQIKLTWPQFVHKTVSRFL